MTLRLYNRGLAAIDVTGFFASVGLSVYHVSPFEFTQSDFCSGPSLPLRLERGSSQTWELSLVQPLTRLAVLDEPARLQHKVNILQFLKPFSFARPSAGVSVALGNATEVIAHISYWKMVELYLQFLRIRS